MGFHTTFPELFRVYDAIQVIVSTASRDNVPIWPDYAVAALTAAIPTCRLSEAELRNAVLDAALQAGVPVRTVSAATFPGSFRTGQTVPLRSAVGSAALKAYQPKSGSVLGTAAVANKAAATQPTAERRG